MKERNNKKKVCFIAQFPPPMHGLAKAVDTLYKSNLNEKYIFEKINITNNRKILLNIIRILFSNADLFYFTICQSKGGNVRDLFILNLIRLKNKKCLIHLHGGNHYREMVDEDMSKWQKQENYKAIKHLQGAIVLSNSLKRSFEGMIEKDKIHVVMNCVDDEFLMGKEEINKKIEVLKNKQILHVLYLSNMIETKGYREVLKMAKMEKNRVETGKEKRFHFNFAGLFFNEIEKEFFEKFVKDQKLSDYVTYHGVVCGQQKKTLLRECDIFILLTRYKMEGQPISILEALGNGMTIVTTDHAGIPDVITNNVNGIVADKKTDTEMVYKKMLSYDNEKFANYCGENWEYCISEFCQKKYINNIMMVFDYCINNDCK